MNAQHSKVDWRKVIPVWRELDPAPKPDVERENAKVVIVGTGRWASPWR